MRNNVNNEDLAGEEILGSIDEDIQEFTEKNEQLDSRRRLEEALEVRRLNRELREFDFDFELDE